MRKHHLIFFCLLATLGAGRWALGQSRLTEDGALNVLTHYLKTDARPRRASLECLSFMTEETAQAYFQFAIREKHGGNCGGDPAVAPVVDRYRVRKNNGEIQRYDVVQDEWKATAKRVK